MIETMVPTTTVRASQQTIDSSKIRSWDVYQDSETDEITVLARNRRGKIRATITIVFATDSFLLTVNGGRVYADESGLVDDTLSEQARHVLSLLEHDLLQDDADARKSATACGLYTVSALATAVSCGLGNIFGCIGTVVAFCKSSQYCGNNVCEF